MLHRRPRALALCLLFSLAPLLRAQPAPAPAAPTAPAPAPAAVATIRVHPDQRGQHPISRFLTGKFCEHLGSNIYNGMLSQIVRNPTFADWPFVAGDQGPDGRPIFVSEPRAVRELIQRLGEREDWLRADRESLADAWADGLAFWWLRQGPRPQVTVSPDAVPAGADKAQAARAQRVEVQAADQGIAQLLWLPLHRVHKYRFQVMVRSPNLDTLGVRLSAAGADEPLASATVKEVTGDWKSFRGELELPATAPADVQYRLALTAPKAGQFVVARIMLWPADDIEGFDPDVVRLLKESRLPMLRWPGGNFVSAYHWEDGVGPVDQRPTRINWAWGGVEPNLFGTDEFIRFCRIVGCEPLICVNGGDGTPAEAARWIEYCNGPASSPMGARRAANGHPEAYNVRYWEAGNELWGRWQVSWTTPAGYADRYNQFATAMRQADPSISLLACGAPVLWGRNWNRALITSAGPSLSTLTDHPLIGGTVPASTDPLDVYRNFLAVPDVLEGLWRKLGDSMREARCPDPRLAITELQLFAHLGDGEGPLNRDTLINPSTQAEAVYDTLMYHAAIRLAPLVDIVTQSATVNHGGGLRKRHERVFASPCHYAQTAFTAFAGATPVAAEVDCAEESAPTVLPDIRAQAGDKLRWRAVSVLAAIDPQGDLLISLVNRSTTMQPLRMNLGGFKGEVAELWTLSADKPWASNTLQRPDAIQPRLGKVSVEEGSIRLELPAYTVARVRVLGQRRE